SPGARIDGNPLAPQRSRAAQPRESTTPAEVLAPDVSGPGTAQPWWGRSSPAPSPTPRSVRTPACASPPRTTRRRTALGRGRSTRQLEPVAGDAGARAGHTGRG